MIYVQLNADGHVTSACSIFDSNTEPDSALQSFPLMIPPEQALRFGKNPVTGEFEEIPDRLAVPCDWDWPTKSWLPNLDAAKAAKKTEIEAERNRRINEPLIYDGKVLDADQAARDNLKAKLEEVRERIRLNMPMAPELLVWRDNANVTHSWPTIEAYHDWLAGYAIAMSDRGTRCYACAWHHKDALKVANDPNGQPWTVESIATNDITVGWPA